MRFSLDPRRDVQALTQCTATASPNWTWHRGRVFRGDKVTQIHNSYDKGQADSAVSRCISHPHHGSSLE